VSDPTVTPSKQRRTDSFRRVLPIAATRIGLVLAPTGLIALFCQLLNMSSQNTAGVSLLCVAIITLCMFRRSINRRIPAVYPLGLLLGMFAVFFFSYQNLLLKNTGLVRFYHHSNDYLSELDRPIHEARHEIWFFGTDFYISAGERREALLEALRRGVHIRYLVFDPASPKLPQLARDFGQTEGELRSECAKSMESLRELARVWREEARRSPTPGELELRLFDVTPRGRLYVFDPAIPGGHSFLVPYVNGANSSELPGFFLRNIETGVYKAYFSGVERLWNEGRPVLL